MRAHLGGILGAVLGAVTLMACGGQTRGSVALAGPVGQTHTTGAAVTTSTSAQDHWIPVRKESATQAPSERFDRQGEPLGGPIDTSPPEVVERRVYDAIARHPELEPRLRTMRVTVEGRRLSVHGKVDSARERYEIEDVIGRFAPGYQLDDQLSIQGLPPPEPTTL